jgi:hypothetical protein
LSFSNTWFATISLFFLALDFLFVHCSTRVFSFPLPHANRPLKMPFATTAAQKISYLTRSFKILGTKCLVFQFSSSSVMWDFPDFYVNNYLTNSSQVYFTLFYFFSAFAHVFLLMSSILRWFLIIYLLYLSFVISFFNQSCHIFVFLIDFKENFLSILNTFTVFMYSLI